MPFFSQSRLPLTGGSNFPFTQKSLLIPDAPPVDDRSMIDPKHPKNLPPPGEMHKPWRRGACNKHEPPDDPDKRAESPRTRLEGGTRVSRARQLGWSALTFKRRSTAPPKAVAKHIVHYPKPCVGPPGMHPIAPRPGNRKKWGSDRRVASDFSGAFFCVSKTLSFDRG